MSEETAGGAGLQQLGEKTGRFYAWLAAVAVGLLVGLYGVVRLLTEGTVVLGINNQLPWGILISTYEYFLLMSAGIMVGIVALAVVFGVKEFELVLKRGALLALGALGAGLLTILVSLGRPERPIIHALINANPSSAIWWVIMFAGSFGVVLLALVVLLETDLGSSRSTLAVGALGVILGIGVATAAGMIFGSAGTRPYWGSALAPVYFVLTGVLSGVAAVTAVVLAEYKASAKEMSAELEELMTTYVSYLLGGLLASVLFLSLIKAITGLTATSETKSMAYEHMLLGSFGPVYWIVGILLGLVVPLALLIYPRTRTPGGILGASGLTLLGLFITKYEFVVGGQVVALTNDPSAQYPLVSYTPSLVEFAVVVFAFTVVAVVYTVGSLVLDLDRLPENIGPADLTPTATTAKQGGDDDD